MKKIIAAVMFLLVHATKQVALATETTDIKELQKPMLNEGQLEKMRAYNLALWAFLKDIQKIGNIANLNIKELEDRFNFGRPFLATNDKVDDDLHNMQGTNYYTDYVSSHNAAKYYLTVKLRLGISYPIESDQQLSVNLNITPSSNQCIKNTGLAFAFNEVATTVVPPPPRFTAKGNTDEEKLASIKKFQDYHRIYRPSYYLTYKYDSQYIRFAWATNGCLLYVSL